MAFLERALDIGKKSYSLAILLLFVIFSFPSYMMIKAESVRQHIMPVTIESLEHASLRVLK
jgi:hypothetical protein